MFRMKNKLLGKGRGKNVYKNSGTYTILGLALFSIAFFGVCTPQGPQFLSGYAGSVGGEEISNVEFVRAYQSYSQQMRRRYGEGYDPVALRIAHSVLDQLIKDRILYLEAQKLGLTTNSEEIVKSLAETPVFQDKDEIGRAHV